MIRPLNDYYQVKLIEKLQKPGLLLSLDNEEQKQIRMAMIVSVPDENELKLAPSDCVYVQQHYGHRIEDGILLIKQDYICGQIKE